MPLESPASVLYNDDGLALAVSGGLAIPVSSSGLLLAGVGPGNTASFARFSALGELLISGSVIANTTITFPATQSVSVLNITTGSANGGLLVNQGLSASFGNSWNVVLSDGTKALGSGSAAPLFVRDAAQTSGSVGQVAISATSVTVLTANAVRQSAFIYNATSQNLFLRFGTTAATTAFYSVRLTSNAFFEVPGSYTGAITGIWASATGGGNALVTELF